jgi:hypothetical protein
VGIETVVIGGITFYCKRRMDILEGEIQGLREQNLKLQQGLDTLARVLEQHDRYLRGESGAMQSSHPPGTQQRPQSVASSQRPPPANTAPQHTAIIEEEPDDEELDGLLQDELSNLKKETPDFIEIECSGDFCEVSLEAPKKKVLRPKSKKVKDV